MHEGSTPQTGIDDGKIGDFFSATMAVGVGRVMQSLYIRGREVYCSCCYLSMFATWMGRPNHGYDLVGDRGIVGQHTPVNNRKLTPDWLIS